MPLYLLPNLLGPVEDHEWFLPKSVAEVVASLDGLIAEDAKEGRAYLKRLTGKVGIPVQLLNEHTKNEELEELLVPIVRGERWGIVSDCGLPCLADPGSAVVLRAHQLNIEVQALVGPSSIVMALMLSGLSGQRFTFHGYISRDFPEKELKGWEKAALDKKETQIFMEAPYRNNGLFEHCKNSLKENTLLSIAVDLTLTSQMVKTLPVALWKKENPPNLHKRPTLFLIG